MTDVLLRAARDEDADGIISVVSGCWGEYPGCVTDIDGEAPELRALASHLAARGGAGWVAEMAGAVGGLVACWPLEDDAWEVGKMYVDATLRGTGAATALLRAAEEHAREHGATALKLWSDTRFNRAHAFYEKHGFLRAGPIRSLDDRSHSIEFGYAKPLRGVAVRALDAAAAGSAVRPLAALLVACVDAGASISFLPPMPRDIARAFWERAATAVATGRRLLLVAWHEGRLAGTVTLDLDTPANQPHRAEVQKLMVHPSARRHGIATALMAAAHEAAATAGRTLLTLDTRAGDAAEALYRALGYVEAGRIPDYALSADGTTHDTVLFWKWLVRPRTADSPPLRENSR